MLAVCVFSRAPVPGRTKTRLIPALGANGAADLHKWMLRRVLTTALSADVGPVELTVTQAHPYFEVLAEAFSLERGVQPDGDLGMRMQVTMERKLAEAAGGVCIVGSDCPGLEPSDFVTTARCLAAGCDLVLGPAHDGGYYLIAMRAVHEMVFHNINWGQPGVLHDTLAAGMKAGLRVELLEMRHDIDTPNDLSFLPECWSGRARVT